MKNRDKTYRALAFFQAVAVLLLKPILAMQSAANGSQRDSRKV